MVHIQDLKLEEDVLPFFDYTNHAQAAACLLRLLKTVPATAAEVLERQAVTQGIIHNWAVLEGFTYRRLDLREVHALFESIQNKSFAPGEGKLTATLKLVLSETERSRLRSRLVQLVLLLNDIHRKYLGRLDTSRFPESFKSQLQHARLFLTKLRLEANAALINEGRFSIPRIVEFTHLLQQLNPQEVKAFWDFFFSFEAYWSVARGTLAHGFTFPSFSAGSFTIQDFYHPIVKAPVRNTLELDADRNVLLLTGPNMSGKSTLLKALGVCVYLAHVGFAVPASACSVPFFNSIAIAINLNDSLRDGYSHFMAEIENLKAVIRSTENSQKCFAVFDEIFRGTNVDDALHITQATLHGLAKRKGSYFLVSTHMLQLEHQLDPSSSASIRKCYIDCAVEDGLPKFSYTLREGWSQLRIGKILFEKAGLLQLLEREQAQEQV